MVSWDGQRDAGRVALPADGFPLPAERRATRSRILEREGRAALEREGIPADDVRSERRLDLRYAGTETAPARARARGRRFGAAFDGRAPARFGYTREGRPVEIVTARVRNLGPAARRRPGAASRRRRRPGVRIPRCCAARRSGFPAPGRASDVPVYEREALPPARASTGPRSCSKTRARSCSTRASVPRSGSRGSSFSATRPGPGARPRSIDLSRPDPIRLEVFGNRFMSIAEQMGAVLRNTSVSTNIKERLDYSCAVFDATGGLVANAPHIPVHLGAMAETVRSVRAEFPDLTAGDVVATNDPNAGGSHLPDVTTVTPVFTSGPEPSFFVASRGHHADIGGKTPGSIPADSRTLEEEGVLIRAFRVVRRGRLDEERLRRLLTAGLRAADDRRARRVLPA